jgi:hypothetical protein
MLERSWRMVTNRERRRGTCEAARRDTHVSFDLSPDGIQATPSYRVKYARVLVRDSRAILVVRFKPMKVEARLAGEHPEEVLEVTTASDPD